MNKSLKLILAALVTIGAAGGLIFAYLQLSREQQAEDEGDTAVAATRRVHTGANGETILTLDEASQKLLALRVETVVPAKLNPELKGYGRVLDPAPLAALAAELASAQTAFTASQEEFERLKELHEQQNAAERTVQAEQATARRDQIEVESVRARLELGWGRAIAEQTNLSAFVQSLVSLESGLARIDLPAGEVVKGRPSGARIVASNSGSKAMPAELLGPAPNVDPLFQGQGFFFLVKENSARLVPGAAVEGYVRFPGETLNGFNIPDSAVVRFAGQGWIYLQTGQETFARRKISLERPLEKGWFVAEGMAAPARVVVSGAQSLLSEEQKNQIKLLD